MKIFDSPGGFQIIGKAACYGDYSRSAVEDKKTD